MGWTRVEVPERMLKSMRETLFNLIESHLEAYGTEEMKTSFSTKELTAVQFQFDSKTHKKGTLEYNLNSMPIMIRLEEKYMSVFL